MYLITTDTFASFKQKLIKTRKEKKMESLSISSIITKSGSKIRYKKSKTAKYFQKDRIAKY